MATDLTPPGKTKAASAPKAPKSPKEPKAPKEPRVSRFAAIYPPTAKLHFISAENPKRGLSNARYAAYMHAKTVKEFLDKGGTYADLAWDVGHGHIRVDAPPTATG